MEGQTPTLCLADGFTDFGGENFTMQLAEYQIREMEWNYELPRSREERRKVFWEIKMAMDLMKERLACKDEARSDFSLFT